jgi:hypothetical protein
VLPMCPVRNVTYVSGRSGGQRRFNLPRPPDPTRGGGLELPLKVVQTGLGHASIQMTADTYGHLFPRGGDGAELAAAEKAFLGA